MENLFSSYNSIESNVRVGLCKKISSEIINYLKETKKYSDENIMDFFLDVLKLAVSADLDFSSGEYEFYTKVIGSSLNNDQLFDRTNKGASKDFKEKMYTTISSFKKDIRNDVFSLILHILAYDGPINDKEKLFFKGFYK